MLITLRKIQKDYEVSHDIPDIFEAAASNDVEALEKSLPHYGVNAKDSDDMTPLHHASGGLAFKTAKVLLAQPDVDTTCEDTFGREAAIMAEEILGMGDPRADEMRNLIWSSPDEDLELDSDDSHDNDADIIPIISDDAPTNEELDM